MKGDGGQDQDPSGPTQFNSLTISTNCFGVFRSSSAVERYLAEKLLADFDSEQTAAITIPRPSNVNLTGSTRSAEIRV